MQECELQSVSFERIRNFATCRAIAMCGLLAFGHSSLDEKSDKVYEYEFVVLSF